MPTNECGATIETTTVVSMKQSIGKPVGPSRCPNGTPTKMASSLEKKWPSAMLDEDYSVATKLLQSNLEEAGKLAIVAIPEVMAKVGKEPKGIKNPHLCHIPSRSEPVSA
jgi:hypothetical protein